MFLGSLLGDPRHATGIAHHRMRLLDVASLFADRLRLGDSVRRVVLRHVQYFKQLTPWIVPLLGIVMFGWG